MPADAAYGGGPQHGPMLRPTAEAHGPERMGGAAMPASESWPLLAGKYGDRCPAVLEAYRLDHVSPDANVFLQHGNAMSDDPFWVNVVGSTADGLAATGGAVWEYLFARAPVYGLGAFHCAEIPYEFYLPDQQYQMSCTAEGVVCYKYSCCDSAADANLASEFLKYLSNLAATGDPNSGKGNVEPVVAWPAYDMSAQRYLSLGDRSDHSATISAQDHMRGSFWLDEAAIAANHSCQDGRTPACGGPGGDPPPCQAGQWPSCRQVSDGSAALAVCAANAPPSPTPPVAGEIAAMEPPPAPAGEQGSSMSNTIVLLLVLLAVGAAAAAAMGKMPGFGAGREKLMAGSELEMTDTGVSGPYAGSGDRWAALAKNAPQTSPTASESMTAPNML